MTLSSLGAKQDYSYNSAGLNPRKSNVRYHHFCKRKVRLGGNEDTRNPTKNRGEKVTDTDRRERCAELVVLYA